MDNDDELAPSALHEFYQKIKKEGSDIIYSDMDIIDAKGKTRDPLCKPDWSPDLFLSQMYLGHLIGFKKSLFEKWVDFAVSSTEARIMICYFE